MIRLDQIQVNHPQMASEHVQKRITDGEEKNRSRELHPPTKGDDIASNNNGPPQQRKKKNVPVGSHQSERTPPSHISKPEKEAKDRDLDGSKEKEKAVSSSSTPPAHAVREKDAKGGKEKEKAAGSSSTPSSSSPAWTAPLSKEKEAKDRDGGKEKEKSASSSGGSSSTATPSSHGSKEKEAKDSKEKEKDRKESSGTSSATAAVSADKRVSPAAPRLPPALSAVPKIVKSIPSHLQQPNMTDYAATRKRFSLYCPSMYNFAYDVMDKWAEREPHRRALITFPDELSTDGMELSFGQLKVASDRAAAAFLKLGLKKGDCVLVLLPSIPEWYSCVLALMKLGVVVCPATHTSTPFEISYRLQQIDAAGIITSYSLAECIEQAEKSVIRVLQRKILVGAAEPRASWLHLSALVEEYDSESAAKTVSTYVAEPKNKTRSTDVMFVCFVSMTSGHPRMISHTHSYALAQYSVSYFVHDLKPDDIHWTVSDYGWARAFWGKLFAPWLIGSTVVQFPQPVRNANRYLKVLSKYKVSVFCATPTLYRKILQENVSRHDLSSLRHCLSVGEALHPVVIQQWRAATGLTVYDHYSQTESGCLLANFRCMKNKDGSMGLPLPGLDVFVVDRDGRIVKDMAEGTVVVRVAPRRPLGVFVFDSLEDRKLTAAMIKHGYYYTMDRAYRDTEGYFWFVGRRDDVFKSAGFRIGPGEIEYALAQHPQVVEAAVVGVPDPTKGLAIKAFVVLLTTFVPTEKFGQELKDHVKNYLAPHLVPRYIEFVSQLPKTLAGQVRRSQLRALELNKAQKQFAKL